MNKKKNVATDGNGTGGGRSRHSQSRGRLDWAEPGGWEGRGRILHTSGCFPPPCRSGINRWHSRTAPSSYCKSSGDGGEVMAQLGSNFWSKEALRWPRSPPCIAWKGKATWSSIFWASRHDEDSLKNRVKIAKDFTRTRIDADVGIVQHSHLQCSRRRCKDEKPRERRKAKKTP